MILWAALSVVATPLVIFVFAPGLPPGSDSSQGAGQVTDNTVLLGIQTPIAMLLVAFFVYSLIVFRHRKSDPEDEEGPAIYGNAGVQNTWLAVTSVVVLFLASYGTVRLFDNGSGGGQGPDPVSKQAGPNLQVQVIGQQWAFTYRWPAYGGVETPHLVLPVNENVEMHVTSLDVIHSFWAHDLGIKADANPGVDNVVFLRPKETTSFDIRCAELCGLFHGHMFDTGQIVSDSAFNSWIAGQQREFAPSTSKLGPYRLGYGPQPGRRAG
ncbi:MAG TPA: cytochrome c oxidase subunit II [Solirubrobacterales bacterium]|jgi:cytochrome c oxidase subunit 2|nr:cytochrome c oxidase subunit II [Solirubrobacterales bacterium]